VGVEPSKPEWAGITTESEVSMTGKDADNPDNKDGGNKTNADAKDGGSKGAGNGTPPEKKGAGNQPGFDPSKLSDEQFSTLFDDERLWKHPRFKQLADEAKQGRKLKKAQEEADKKKLEEEGEFKQLYEKEKDRNKDLAISAAIQAAASQAGAVDLEAVTKLVDRGSIEVDDEGNVKGADEAVKTLIEAKPFLKGDGSTTPSVGSGTNPSSDGSTPGKFKFKHSQLLDSKFYEENEAEILEAMKNNQIEQDLPA